MAFTLESPSLEATFEIGETIARTLKDGSVIALQGQLGGGKTHLAKGLARGLGVDRWQRVTSPTFTLLATYRGERTLHHMDLYRLADGSDVPQELIEAIEDRNALSAVEWGDLMPDLLPAGVVEVDCEVIDEDSRRFTIECDDAATLQALSAALGQWRA